MTKKNLKNKPLVETIVEIKWKLNPHSENYNSKIDPNYKILLGRLFDKLSGPEGKFPRYEELPSSRIPEELAEHVVQHRFSSEDGRCAVQVGPGVFTLNQTEGYSWKTFKQNVIDSFGKFFEVYPDIPNLKIESLSLRYLNSLELDFESENIHQFLREKMKISILYPESLFDNSEVIEKPLSMKITTAFKCIDPEGIIRIRLGSGTVEGKKSLIWETTFRTEEQGIILKSLESLTTWLTDAHNVIEDWFFKIIEGELERRFMGE